MGEKQVFIGLKKFRERKRFRQNQLAEMLGISNTVYNYWEKGRNNPSFVIYQKLIEMGATVEELFGIPYSARADEGEPGLLEEIKNLKKRVEDLERGKSHLSRV